MRSSRSSRAVATRCRSTVSGSSTPSWRASGAVHGPAAISSSLGFQALAAVQLHDRAATGSFVEGGDRGVSAHRGARRDRAGHHAGGRARRIGVAGVALEGADPDVVQHELRELAAELIGPVQVDRDVELVQAAGVVRDLVGILRRMQVEQPGPPKAGVVALPDLGEVGHHPDAVARRLRQEWVGVVRAAHPAGQAGRPTGRCQPLQDGDPRSGPRQVIGGTGAVDAGTDDGDVDGQRFARQARFASDGMSSRMAARSGSSSATSTRSRRWLKAVRSTRRASSSSPDSAWWQARL